MVARHMRAITREISPSIGRCELVHLARTPIDVPRARMQHERYERCLAEAGYTVERLRSGPDLPDAVFVEDVAVVVDECAVIARPGAASRRSETPAVAEALRQYRMLHEIAPPATLDGGDVLIVGHLAFVGRSARTNDAGMAQLRIVLGAHGYDVRAVPVGGCLHLKSAVTAVSDDTLLVNRAWVPAGAFAGFTLVDVDPDEPYAANALRLVDRIVYPTAFPKTLARLETLGVRVEATDLGELAKAEGAVTCCSVIFAERM
jgi:dimethylargininase